MRFNRVFAFANFTFWVFFVGLSQAEVDLDSLVGFWAFNEGTGDRGHGKGSIGER